MKKTLLKSIFTLLAIVLGTNVALAQETTTLYERGTEGNAWSDADLTEWTTTNTNGYVPTVSTDGIAVTVPGSGKAWDIAKAIAPTSNTSILTLTATFNPGNATGQNNSTNGYLQFGDIKFAFYGQNRITKAVIGGVETTLDGVGKTRSRDYSVEVIINQATGAVSYSFTDNGTTVTGTGTSTSAGAFTSLVYGLGGKVPNWDNTATLKSIVIKETAQVVKTANYTINYTLDGTVVKQTTSSTVVGETVEAESVVTDNEGQKYLIVADKVPSLTITEDETTNVLNVPVRKPYVGTLNVTTVINGVAGEPVSTTFTELDDKTNPWSYTYSLYAESEGVYYIVDTPESFELNGNFTGDETVEKTISYTNKAEDIAYFGEWETAYESTSNTYPIHDNTSFSNGKGRAIMKTDATMELTFNVAKEGNYTIEMPYYNSNGSNRTHIISIDGGEEESTTVSGNSGGTYSKAIDLLPGGHTVLIKCDYSLTAAFDYLKVKYNGELLDPSIKYVAYEAVDLQSCVDNGGVRNITADTTIVCKEFTLDITASTTNTPNKWGKNTYYKTYQLIMNSGTLTFKANEGKVINKITFPACATATAAKVKFTPEGYTAPVNATGNNGVWTGEANTVVVEFLGQVTLTGIEVGEKPIHEVTKISDLKNYTNKDLINLNLDGANVMYVNPKSTRDEIFVTDGTGYLMLNKTGLEMTAGKSIKGNIYGMIEIDTYNVITFTKSDKTAESAFELTDADYSAAVVADLSKIGAEHVNGLITLEKVNLSWDSEMDEGTVSQGAASYALSKNFVTLEGILPEYAEKITGIVHMNGKDIVFAPIGKDSITAGTPPTVDVENIGALAAESSGAYVKLALTDAVVTVAATITDDYGTETSVAYVQDKTGAVKLDGIALEGIAANKKLNGSLVAKLTKTAQNICTLSNMSITATESVFTAADSLFVAEQIDSIHNVDISYANKLVTLLGVDIEWVVNPYFGGGEGYISQKNAEGEETAAGRLADPFGLTEDGYAFPKRAIKISGIVDNQYGSLYFYPISTDSIEAAPVILRELANIAELKAMTTTEDIKLKAENLMVTVSIAQEGMMGRTSRQIFIEDATGAAKIEMGGMMMGGSSYDVPEVLKTAGGIYNGILYLTVDASQVEYGGSLVIAPSDSTETRTKLVAVEGKVAEPTVMTIADAKKPENNYRWVKFEDVETAFNSETNEYNYRFVMGTDSIDYLDEWSNMPKDSTYDEDYGEYMYQDRFFDKYDNVTAIIEYNSYDDYYVAYPVSCDTIAPQAILTVTEDYKFIPSDETIAAAEWLIAGSTVTNKNSTINPSTGEEEKGKYYGIYTKEKTHDAKFVKLYVTGAEQIIGYAASTGGDTDRNITVEAYEWDAAAQATTGEAISNVVASAPYTTVTPSIKLDASKAYQVQFYSAGDCAIYGIWFMKTATGITDVNATVNVLSGDVYSINGVKVRNAGESLNGLKGLYIINGKKVVIK